MTLVSQLPCNLDPRLRWRWQKEQSVTPVWAHISTLFVEPGVVPKTLACTVSHFALGHGSADEFYKKYTETGIAVQDAEDEKFKFSYKEVLLSYMLVSVQGGHGQNPEKFITKSAGNG